MIKSEVASGKLVAAVLAGMIVANINVLSAEANRAVESRPDVSPEPENAGQLEAAPDASGEAPVVFEDVHLSLEEHHYCLLPADNAYGLVACIQQQGLDGRGNRHKDPPLVPPNEIIRPA